MYLIHLHSLASLARESYALIDSNRSMEINLIKLRENISKGNVMQPNWPIFSCVSRILPGQYVNDSHAVADRF